MVSIKIIKSAIRISSAIKKQIGFIFLWNIPLTGASSNSNYMYLYLSNRQEKIVKYESC